MLQEVKDRFGYKYCKMKGIKISLILVVYNAEESIERTLKSIASQSKKLIELIVIDGNSTDSTLPVLKKYHSLIDVLVSETDDGLYHAMNKGKKLAKGDFAFFINAGDLFINQNVIENVCNSIQELEKVYYGNTIVYFDSTFRTAPLTHHQSIFFPRKFYKSCDYQVNKYDISAEADFIYKSLYKYEGRHIDVDIVFSKIEGFRVHCYSTVSGTKKIYSEVTTLMKEHKGVVPLSFKLTYPLKSMVKFLAFKLGGLKMVANILLFSFKTPKKSYSLQDVEKIS